VGFSSAASLLGSPGQAAYAAASAWLDAMVAARAASGLPASTINWGPWSEVGVAQTLAASALDPITPEEGLEALGALLGSNRTNTGVARLRTDRALIAFPEIRELGYFSQVVAEIDTLSDIGDWAGPDALRELDPVAAQRAAIDRLAARIAAVMGFRDQGAVDADEPLTGLGMDSLMAVRIRNAAKADFGVEPPVALLLQGATLGDVAADLLNQLGIETAAGRDVVAQQVDAVRDRAQQRAAARRNRRQRG
jgi:phthiocerol/phenolphthiocerol synthesis type-I polyketide synthase D